MKVTIPAKEQHMGHYAMTVDISDDCPKCGAKRGVQRWKGLSYDGSLRLEVDCWSNECGHVDMYSEVRKEVKEKHLWTERNVKALFQSLNERISKLPTEANYFGAVDHIKSIVTNLEHYFLSNIVGAAQVSDTTESASNSNAD